MKVQDWIFTIHYLRRTAVIGPARASTVEAALHRAEVPEALRTEIRSCPIVRDFVEGQLDPERHGYYTHAEGSATWAVCIGSVHDVLGEGR